MTRANDRKTKLFIIIVHQYHSRVVIIQNRSEHPHPQQFLNKERQMCTKSTLYIYSGFRLNFHFMCLQCLEQFPNDSFLNGKFRRFIVQTVLIFDKYCFWLCAIRTREHFFTKPVFFFQPLVFLLFLNCTVSRQECFFVRSLSGFIRCCFVRT